MNIENLPLTTDQLVQLLGVSKMTIHRWRIDGLPFSKEGKTVRFNLNEVQNWLEANEIRIKYSRG